VYQPLERFLGSLSLPLIARLSDSDAYLKAAEMGLGIFEMDFSMSFAEREQFAPIVKWVDNQQPAPVRIDEKVRRAAAPSAARGLPHPPRTGVTALRKSDRRTAHGWRAPLSDSSTAG